MKLSTLLKEQMHQRQLQAASQSQLADRAATQATETETTFPNIINNENRETRDGEGAVNRAEKDEKR